MAQSESIGRWLNRLNPRVEMRLVGLESEGDRVIDHPLAAVGGKGLFTRAIEQALLEGKADIAVHSLKDMPTQPTAGLVIAAIPRRLPVHDVLIARKAATIHDLPHSASIGTCSPRRQAQLLKLRGDLRVSPMRGNVDTRLRKVLDEQQFDGTLLAAAGLIRLGLDAGAQAAIPVEEVLPAAGQGALAIQCRVDDHISLRRCMPLNDAATSLLVNAERQLVADLQADCHSPLAVLAQEAGRNQLRIRARVLSPDGATCLEADLSGPTKSVRKLCRTMADQLLSQGARQILQDAAKVPVPSHQA
jgi:hydroxymethylbilane synthase